MVCGQAWGRHGVMVWVLVLVGRSVLAATRWSCNALVSLGGMDTAAAAHC